MRQVGDGFSFVPARFGGAEAARGYYQIPRPRARPPPPGYAVQGKAQPTPPAFAQQAEGADAAQVADLSVSTWRKVDAALSPVIGQRGVAALYKRSLYLTRAAHPCLAAVYEGALGPGEFAGLHAALAGQSSSDAAAANGALLQTFHDLLANLIGASLTGQLLRPVLTQLAPDNPSSGHAVQDPSS